MPDYPHQQLACPYDDRLFQSEEDLWMHVSGDHAQLLKELGIKEDTALYRKLLRKEAVDKAKALKKKDQSQKRSATAVQYTQDPPDLRKLSPDASRASSLGPTVYSSDQEETWSAEAISQDGASPDPMRPAIRVPLSRSGSRPAAPAAQAGSIQTSSAARWPELLLRPNPRPIPHKQLVADVKSIYAGLTMVETKCIHVHKTQATAEHGSCQSKLATDHWQALIALHRTLLHEHHDFFLASQHPSASPALRRVAAKYSMPAPVCKHGIHSFLELYETIGISKDTRIECLDDLDHYCMATKNSHDWFRDRKLLVAMVEQISLLLKSHCAPMRDEMVDEMLLQVQLGVANDQADRILSGLQKLRGILETMRLDIVNYQSRYLRPILIDETIDLERKYREVRTCRERYYRWLDDRIVLPHTRSRIALFAAWRNDPKILGSLPWADLTTLLTTLADDDSSSTAAPDDIRPLPEDLILRGQIWAQSYFSERRFDEAGSSPPNARPSDVGVLSNPTSSALTSDIDQQLTHITTKDDPQHHRHVSSQIDCKVEERSCVRGFERAGPIKVEHIGLTQLPTKRTTPEGVLENCTLNRMPPLGLRSLLSVFAFLPLFNFIRPVGAEDGKRQRRIAVKVPDATTPTWHRLDPLATNILSISLSLLAVAAIVAAGPGTKPYAVGCILGLPIAWLNLRADPSYNTEVGSLLVYTWLVAFLAYIILFLKGIYNGRESDQEAAPVAHKTNDNSVLPPFAPRTAITNRATRRADQQLSETVVILMPDPTNVPQIRKDEEARKIEMVKERDRLVNLEVKFHLNCRISEISDIIRRSDATFFHIICHGSKKGPLFQNDLHQPATVLPKQFASILKQAKRLKCVLINACFSSEYGAVIANVSGAIVIGMNDKVGDRAAINFATEFFKAVADGQSIAEACDTAKYAAGMYSNGGRLRPEIFQPTPTHIIPIA